jgi:IclR family acetate operon transcriptional repressor
VGDIKTASSVEAIERAIRILDSFSIARPELGVAEISRFLGLKRSTVHRALSTLEAGGVLRQDPATQKYALGSKVLKFAHVLNSQLSLNAIALPHMRALRDRFNETVALHVREGDARVVVLQVESTHDLRRIYHETGTPLPLHAGSPGRAILAFLSPEDIRRIVGEEALDRLTENTLTNQADLLSSLSEARRRGYTASVGERSEGISSISCPIFDRTGRAVAAINISGPEVRFTRDRALECLPALSETTRSISRELGWYGHAAQH